MNFAKEMELMMKAHMPRKKLDKLNPLERQMLEALELAERELAPSRPDNDVALTAVRRAIAFAKDMAK